MHTLSQAIAHIWLMCKLISSLGTYSVRACQAHTHTQANGAVISCKNTLAGVLEHIVVFQSALAFHCMSE